jgi:hypothetical protein
MPEKPPLCLLCGRRRARPLVSTREYAAREPVFCGRRCATDYGLIIARFELDNAELHLCPRTGKFEPGGGGPGCCTESE